MDISKLTINEPKSQKISFDESSANETKKVLRESSIPNSPGLLGASNVPFGQPTLSTSSQFIGDAVKQIQTDLFKLLKKIDADHNRGINCRDESGEGTNGEILLSTLIEELEQTGIYLDDTRLKDMKKAIEIHDAHQVEINKKKNTINFNEFNVIIGKNIDLVYNALKRQLVISDFKKFTEDIKEIYYEVLGETELGKNASYIPQLDNVDSNYWGISVCTVDGQRFNIGDTDIPFTVQSTSKAINYAIALSKYGCDKVHNHIGREPSGRLFNDICLDEKLKYEIDFWVDTFLNQELEYNMSRIFL